MTTKVKVVADNHGNIINVSKNPEYGYVRVEQRVSVINDQGWFRLTKRSALIKGRMEDLIEANFQVSQELPGRIIVVESHQPFNIENPDRDLKIAGDTGVICRVNDQPIYRQTFYTPNENAIDELIMHTNSDEIKEVQAASKVLNHLQKEDIKTFSNRSNVTADL